jgi:hypothetical protein
MEEIPDSLSPCTVGEGGKLGKHGLNLQLALNNPRRKIGTVRNDGFAVRKYRFTCPTSTDVKVEFAGS